MVPYRGRADQPSVRKPHIPGTSTTGNLAPGLAHKGNPRLSTVSNPIPALGKHRSNDLAVFMLRAKPLSGAEWQHFWPDRVRGGARLSFGERSGQRANWRSSAAYNLNCTEPPHKMGRLEASDARIPVQFYFEVRFSRLSVSARRGRIRWRTPRRHTIRWRSGSRLLYRRHCSLRGSPAVERGWCPSCSSGPRVGCRPHPKCRRRCHQDR